jgi:phosphoglycerate dehydrogenase-like enzyme
LLPQADVVALTCALTPETEKLIDGRRLALMKPSLHLVNVARRRCIDEAALIEALTGRRIAGAALDVFVEEPLPPSSPLSGCRRQRLHHTAYRRRDAPLRGERHRLPR